MAVESLCGKLMSGIDLSCLVLTRKYYQQAVLINFSDIDEITINKPEEGACDYNVEFTLKEGTTGYRILGNEAGSTFFGSVDKTRNEIGNPEYKHNVQILMAGISEETKCILDALDRGSFLVAMQAKDGTVEIYGAQSGLSSDDYTYNIQENGGGTQIVLTSMDDSPEGLLPLVYKSGTPGNEAVDFDDAFENL